MDYVFKLGLTTLHSIVEHNGKSYPSIQLRINKHAILIIITKLKEKRSNFQLDFCSCFVVELVMQHEPRCVKLWSRSWRTWNMNWITPRGLKVCMCYLVTFHNRTPIFDQRVVWWGSKKKHHKDTHARERLDYVFKLVLTTLHLIVEHNGKSYPCI